MKVLAMLLAIVPAVAWSQADAVSRSWNQPIEPFRIIGNIYYVGASDVTSYLITTPQGHILLDSGFFETVPQIVQNVPRLGFRVEDIKLLINSHAHMDHAGGLALLKRITGANLAALHEEVPLLEQGGRNDFAWGDTLAFEPVQVDRQLRDGEVIRLGGVTMVPHRTAGHTRGCTTWTTEVSEDGRKYQVVFVGSASVPGYQLVNNSKYPSIMEDYRKTFRTLRALEPDVFLAPHGSFFGLNEKRARQKADPSRNPFIASRDYVNYVNRAEADFEKRVSEQRAVGAKAPESRASQ